VKLNPLFGIRPVFALASLLVCGGVWAEPPRLVVVISVDQMRADYLDVFAAHYDGGLQLLREKGAVFTDAHQDHSMTQTAAGHATISTGVFPARHGVVANQFYDRPAQQLAGAVADPSSLLVGAADAEGSSPFRLERQGLAGWLKTAYPQSKVASVSVKDRAAILMGGQSADMAFWIDLRSGHFVTSDYYMPALPEWASSYNAMGELEKYNGTQWARLMPDAVYDSSPWAELAGRDPNEYATLPRALGAVGEPVNRRYFLRFRGSPFVDLETLNFAEALLEQEGFGRDDNPDLLFVGLSAADYIGHRSGPYSDEIHDQFLRLDGYLEDFFTMLDEKVGSNNYVIAVSADHGALPVPEQLMDLGIHAGRVGPNELLQFVMPTVEAAYTRGEISAMPALEYASGPAFVFDGESPPAAELDALQRKVAAVLVEHPAVAAAYPYNDLLAGEINDEHWRESVQRSFHPERAPDVTIRLRENFILRPNATGTSHGSPYRYDTHVPIVFYGAGVAAGHHDFRVRTTDIAPTLAKLLEISPPNDLDGRDLSTSFQIQAQ
jgi:predicted AlkP superfamily pyrophosphatase or phosphodiesterase